MFFLIKTKIAPYLSLIKLVVRGAVLLLILYLIFMNHKYQDEIRTYKTNEKFIEQVEQTHKANLTAQKAQIERDWANDRIKAHEEFTAEIKRIHDMHANRLRDIGRVQDRAKEIIKYLPDYSRPALETVASTTTNSAIECSALLVEVEQVAYGYSAEIDWLIRQFPKNIDPKNTVLNEIPESRKFDEPVIKPEPKPYLD